MNDREIIRLEQFRQLKKEIREGDEKGFVQNVHNAPTAEHLNIHNQFLYLV